MKNLFGAVLAVMLLLPCLSAAAPQDAEAVFGIGGVLIGAYTNGQWIKAETMLNEAPYRRLSAKAGSIFSVYSPNGLEGKGRISALYGEEPEPPMYDVIGEGGKKLGSGQEWFAIRCGWDPMPRKATAIASSHPTYSAALKKYLAGQGLPHAKPVITQILKIDLEGDGVDEVVLCAHSLNKNWNGDKPSPHQTGLPFSSSKGDFSLILLRKIINGNVREILVQGFFADKAGLSLPPTMHKVIGFADLNGDGTLEIITDSSYYEGFWYGVQEVKKDKITEVIGNGMGA